MKPEDRIKQYQKALDFYKKYPNGIGIPKGSSYIGVCFHGICDLIKAYDEGERLPELSAIRPNDPTLFWWAESPAGVKTRIKKLNLMIKMAKAKIGK